MAIGVAVLAYVSPMAWLRAVAVLLAVALAWWSGRTRGRLDILDRKNTGGGS